MKIKIKNIQVVITFILYFTLFSFNSTAQNVGINTTGTPPNEKALLDIDTDGTAKKGLLVPRMTTAERNTITAPIPESLLIYNTTTECYEGWSPSNAAWVPFGCIGCYSPTNVTASASSTTVCEGSTLTLTGNANDATSWSWTGPNGYTSSAQNPTISNISTTGAGVYTLTATNSCGSETASTSAITVNEKPTTANAGTDIDPACGVTTATLSGNTPTVGSGIWSVVSGTATITTPSSPTSGVTGLSSSGTATLRWTISNSPCTASTDEVIITTCEVSTCADNTTTVTDVTSTTGKVWMDRNLGASQVANSKTDTDAYGGLFQWGRCADGHEKRNSNNITAQSTTDDPGHEDFIIGHTDWRNPKNDNLWQGAAGTNNPCPSGYRIPSETELENERQSWSNNNASGAYNSPLKWTLAGYRKNSDGVIFQLQSFGSPWSSTIDGTRAKRLYFKSNGADVVSLDRAWGMSVRCIKD